MPVRRIDIYRKSFNQVVRSLQAAVQSGDIGKLDVQSFLERRDSQTVEGVDGVARALRNVRLASQLLSGISSPRYKCPRGTSYRELITYHHTFALHEAGVQRNRLVRLLRQLADKERGVGKLDCAEILDSLRDGFVAMNDDAQKLRDQHVHQETYFPPNLVSDGMRALLQEIPASKRVAEWKRQARLSAEYWLRMADLMDAAAVFTLNLTALAIDGKLTRRAAKAQLRTVNAASARIHAQLVQS
jgi:hypothetical protein